MGVSEYVHVCPVLSQFRGTGANQKVAIGTKLPGDVMAFGITPGNGFVFTYDAFVAGSANLAVSTRFSGCCACDCADEAPFLTKVTVDDGDMGIVIGGGYGMIERHDIPPGESLYVSRGLFFAAREDISFEVGLVGGLSNLCCTGGGIVMKFHGPGAVYTSSKNPTQLLRDFGCVLPSFLPLLCDSCLSLSLHRIPGGREKNLKYAKIWRCLVEVAKLFGEAAEKGAQQQ